MMSTLNFTIIPLLLDAFISDKNETKWIFGPECVYDLHRTLTIFKDDVNMVEIITATVQCRPDVSSKDIHFLYCSIRKIFLYSFTQQKIEYNALKKISAASFFIPRVEPIRLRDQYIGMDFPLGDISDKDFYNIEDQGNIKYREPLLYYVFPDEHFDVEFDLSGIIGDSMKDYKNKTGGTFTIGSYMTKDVMVSRDSTCDVSGIVTYTPSNNPNDEKKFLDHTRDKSEFYVKLRDVSYTNPFHKSFSIERTMTACSEGPDHIQYLNKKHLIGMTHWSNRKTIHGTKPKFISSTHLEGFVEISENKPKYTFEEDIHLVLLRISPAHKQLNKTEYL